MVRLEARYDKTLPNVEHGRVLMWAHSLDGVANSIRPQLTQAVFKQDVKALTNPAYTVSQLKHGVTRMYRRFPFINARKSGSFMLFSTSDLEPY